MRWPRNALLFAACLLLTASVLRAATSPTPAGTRAEWAHEHPDAYDTLFVGSSRTARQISPETFDRAMAEQGLATRSFNLGYPSLWPPEDGYLLERTLAGRQVPLRFLIVECNPIRLGVPPELFDTARGVHWHDLARMRVIWRHIVAISGERPQPRSRTGNVRRQLPVIRQHLRHWAWNALRLGRGAELFQAALGPGGERLEALGPRGDGYVPHVRARDGIAADARSGYERAVVETPTGAGRLRRGDAESQAELRRKRALAARYAAELILVAPPVTGPTFAPSPDPSQVFLDLSDPLRYPELFAPANRFDAGHLNARGAEVFSRLLARELGAALATRLPDTGR